MRTSMPWLRAAAAEDGSPSAASGTAGVTIVTSLVSALLQVPVRKDVAMTGEINLRGKVLPIGGLKDKILAAFRGEMKTVICPRDNEKDLVDVPKHVLKALDIKLADTIDDVLRWALVALPEDHPNVALREFLAGVDVTTAVDWRVVNRYLEERRRKDRDTHESGGHGPH